MVEMLVHSSTNLTLSAVKVVQPLKSLLLKPGVMLIMEPIHLTFLEQALILQTSTATTRFGSAGSALMKC
jgi:hypothetical protein